MAHVKMVEQKHGRDGVEVVLRDGFKTTLYFEAEENVVDWLGSYFITDLAENRRETRTGFSREHNEKRGYYDGEAQSTD